MTEAFKQGFMDKIADFKGRSEEELRMLAPEFVDDTLLPPYAMPFVSGPMLRTNDPYWDMTIEHTAHKINPNPDDELKAALKDMFDADSLALATHNAKARQAAKEFLKRYYSKEPLTEEEFLTYRRRANLPKKDDKKAFEKHKRSLFKRPSTYVAAALGAAPGLVAGLLTKDPILGGGASIVGSLLALEGAREAKNEGRMKARSYAKGPDELMYDVLKEQDDRERALNDVNKINDMYLTPADRKRALKRSAKGLKKFLGLDLSKTPVTVTY